MANPDHQVDIAVIGAGLAGTCTAILMARAGHSVTLVDTHRRHPDEFRAEKMGGFHMALFDRLGLGDVVRDIVTPIEGVWVYRFGRLVARETWPEYGFAYCNLVNGLRAALPPDVRFHIGRVAEVATGPERQEVTFADGSMVSARLIVLATGLGDAVRRRVGVTRRETAAAHSLSLAFTLTRPVGTYPFGSLTYYPKDVTSRFAYLTLFPIGGAMRGNLFAYRQAGEAWTKAFRRDPQAALREIAPEIAGICGDFAIAAPVAVRPIDLIVTEDYRREGIVLVGDAFCTTCPAPGVGIQRVMTDVEQLCTLHLPRWLASPGMGSRKIERYYDDPIKQAMDRGGIDASMRALAIATDMRLRWRARRLCNNIVRRGLYAGRAVLNGSGTRLPDGPPPGFSGTDMKIEQDQVPRIAAGDECV